MAYVPVARSAPRYALAGTGGNDKAFRSPQDASFRITHREERLAVSETRMTASREVMLDGED